MFRKLFSHTAIYGLAPYIPKLLSFITLPIITKDLTSADYGIAGIISSYAAAIGVFSTLGLRLVLVNSFYHYQQQFKWLWRQLYGFLSIWIFIYAFLLAILLYFVIPIEAIDNKLIIILLNTIPIVCFGPVSMMGSTYYQLKQQPMQIAGRTVILGLLTISLNVYFITTLKLGYMGWFITDCIVGLLSNGSYWYAMNKKLGFTPIFNFKWRLIKKSLKISIPTVPHYYSTYLLNVSDKMVLDRYRIPIDNIGKYNMAGNFGNYFSSLANASGLAVGPMLNRLYKLEDEKGARFLIFSLQCIFLIGTVLFGLWSKEIFYVLIRNEELQKVYPLAIIIVMSYNYRPMYFGANAKLMYVEKTNVLWKVTFVAGIINVILNIIFVPFYGIIASAIITYISYMYMGYSGYFFRIYKKYHPLNYYPMWWLGLTVFVTISTYYLVELQWIIKLTISVALITSLFWIYQRYKSLSPEDV